MIIPQENIETFVSKNDGQYSTYKLHVPSNVFFERVKQERTNDFVGFRVARFDAATNTVVDEQKFNGTRDTSFFKAVDYFEELIEKNSPKEEQGKQDDFDSVGYFVYFKGGYEDAFIQIDDSITEIPYADIDKVFAPPQTKKYGRLDMTVLDDPKYDVVRSKFALKYDEQKSTEIASTRGLTKEDVWVYEMQPYSNGTPEEEGGGGTPPPDVNDQPLNANDIEGEEPKQREPKEGEKGEKGEKGEDGENSDNDENGENGEDEDLGWDEGEDQDSQDSGDEQGDDTDDPSDNGNPSDDDSEGEESDDPSDNGNPNPFGDNEDTGNPPPPNNGGTPTGEGEPTDEEGTPVAVYNMDLIEALNTAFKTDDILSAYKTQKTFMSALRLKGDQIKEFAPFVGLDANATKQEVLSSIEEQLTPFYQ